MERLNQLINDFLQDESYPVVSRWNQTRQIFDVLQPNETSLSRVIAWLLNPREGHSLGDYFVKALLHDAIANGQVKTELNALDIESLKLDDLGVVTEYSIPDGRIDLLLTDIESKLVVIIEHKYGARENNNQLSTYSAWVEEYFENNRNSYTILRVIMDGADMIRRTQLGVGEVDKWAIVSHDWLLKALEVVIDSESVCESINVIFKDLFIHLSGGQYEGDAFFEQGEKELAGLATRHSELIDVHRKKEIMFNDASIVISSTTDVGFLAELQNMSVECRGSLLKSYNFFKKNNVLLSWLALYSNFEWLQGMVETEMPGMFEVCCHGNYASVFLKTWERYQREGREYLPFYLKISSIEGKGYNYSLFMIRSGFKDENLSFLISEGYGRPLRKNWSKDQDIPLDFIPEGVDCQEEVITQIRLLTNEIDQRVRLAYSALE